MTFILKNTQKLPTLGITLETYEHVRTGAMHYHFAADNNENVFMVALRTMPWDSTGVAHILEHTALCGSEHFPVRDPFFSMLRRSMQTFMNAFTSSDWTAYPFATENRQDFDNLLQIYLDAVFFPRLDRLDFLQEGHRYDFDGDKLITKGVVYNEMKGVYGNAIERIYEVQKSLLQPTTTYHHDSGGTPSHILDLSYEDLLAFHKKHYHPTNATFFTYGNIPAAEHQERFEALALHRFEGRGEKVEAHNEKRMITPLVVESWYPSSDREDPNQVHILFSWLLPFAHDPRTKLECELLYRYLLGSSASVLTYALENAEYTRSLSPLSMLDDSGRELRLSTGIITDDPKYASEVENLVVSVLKKEVEQGIKSDELLAHLDRMEISLREGTTGYPYGLSLFLQAIGGETHGGDIATMLDPTVVLDELRTAVEDPHFLSRRIEEYLLDNPHRMRLVMRPDFSAGEKERQIEQEHHAQVLERMTPEEKTAIIQENQSLDIRQKTPDNADILPRLRVLDIPPLVRDIRASRETQGRVTRYVGATNHLEYQHLLFPIGDMTPEMIVDLGRMMTVFGEVAVRNHDYVEVQKAITRETGGVDFSLEYGKKYGQDQYLVFLKTGVRFLDRKEKNALLVWLDIVREMRFEEYDHIQDLYTEELIGLKSHFVQAGHQIALTRARSGYSQMAAFSEAMKGIDHIQWLKALLALDATASQKKHQDIFAQAKKYTPLEFSIGSRTPEALWHDGEDIWNPLDLPYEQKIRNEAWILDIALCYCALVVPTAAPEHPDTPALKILGQFLRDGYLHSAIREQGGAYGSGAMYHGESSTFSFHSYRDPRLGGTYQDFVASIDWLLNNDHDPLRLEEAKLGVFSSLDTPTSVQKEAEIHYIQHLFGKTDTVRNQERQALLAVTMDDLKRVAREYFIDLSQASRVVLMGPQYRDEAEKMGFEVSELLF